MGMRTRKSAFSRTPCRLATYELVAAAGAKADEPAAGQWKLTMPTAGEPFERTYDASCLPIGLDKPLAPVDPDKWRAEDSARAKPKAGRHPPTVAIKTVQVTGPLTSEASMAVFEKHQQAFTDCFMAAREFCSGCVTGLSADFTLDIAAEGKVSSVDFASAPQPNKGDLPDAAALKFGQCAQQEISGGAYPAQTSATRVVQHVLVLAAQRTHDPD